MSQFTANILNWVYLCRLKLQPQTLLTEVKSVPVIKLAGIPPSLYPESASVTERNNISIKYPFLVRGTESPCWLLFRLLYLAKPDTVAFFFWLASSRFFLGIIFNTWKVTLLIVVRLCLEGCSISSPTTQPTQPATQPVIRISTYGGLPSLFKAKDLKIPVVKVPLVTLLSISDDPPLHWSPNKTVLKWHLNILESLYLTFC